MWRVAPCRNLLPPQVGPFLKFWGLQRLGEAAETPTNHMAFKEEQLQGSRVSVEGRSSAQRTQAKAAATAASAAEPRVWLGSVLLVTKAPVEQVVVTMQVRQHEVWGLSKRKSCRFQ